MATATETLPPPETEAPPNGLPEGVPYRLSAADFFRMVELDIIPRERRVGLWEGQLYEKMGKNLPHSISTTLAATVLMRLLPADWCVWIESPVLVNDETAPLPDLTVVRGPVRDYLRRGSNPAVADIGLVLEVADTSLRKNLTRSLRTYARAGIPVYWVVNLVANRVEVYSQPIIEGDAARYASAEVFEPGKEVPLVLGGREVARIPARDLLPVEGPA
jgi:Uma2 family endonuclease